MKADEERGESTNEKHTQTRGNAWKFLWLELLFPAFYKAQQRRREENSPDIFCPGIFRELRATPSRMIFLL